MVFAPHKAFFALYALCVLISLYRVLIHNERNVNFYRYMLKVLT